MQKNIIINGQTVAIETRRFDNQDLPKPLVDAVEQAQQAVVAFRDKCLVDLQDKIETYYAAMPDDAPIAYPVATMAESLGRPTTLQDALKKAFKPKEKAATQTNDGTTIFNPLGDK